MSQQQLKIFEPQEKTETTMMQQYASIKSAHENALLFFRVGDFYELFNDDAVVAAPILEVTLTSRNKNNPNEMPMCGVPHHAYELYAKKLLNKGYSIAICDQVETPEEAKKRGYKAIVKREVTKILTPSTILEENLYSGENSKYLASIVLLNGKIIIAWAEIRTGEFFFNYSTTDTLANDLARTSPLEVLISVKDLQVKEVSKILYEGDFNIVSRANNIYDFTQNKMRLEKFFGSEKSSLFENYAKEEVICCGALLQYIEHTCKKNLPYILLPKRLQKEQFLQIDKNAFEHLEILKSVNGNKKFSLYGVLNHTITSSGARLLEKYISTPLINVEAINNRLDAVEYFINNVEMREKIKTVLANFPDVERAIGRIHSNKFSPKDLGIVRLALNTISNLSILLNSHNNYPVNLKIISNSLSNFEFLKQHLNSAINNIEYIKLKEDNFIKDGFHAKYDEIKDLNFNAQQRIDELCEKYKNLTGVNSLKIAYNNVIGFYVEVSKNNEKHLNSEQFQLRQSLKNSSRFYTNELKNMEIDLLSCDEQKKALEQDIMQNLGEEVIKSASLIITIAQNIANLDVYCCLATISSERNYSRPNINDSNNFEIIEGKHPIIALELKNNFVANDCVLNESQKISLITGANMAGKSTYLRQNALIVIMAQLGCFVPAKQCNLGVVHKVFSRIGASDNIAKGQSTFMVEMIETANIINHANSKSLIILDEIGRGTATHDGISIAWAILEYIHNKIDARTLFATHYHELSELENTMENLKCYTVSVKEFNNQIAFLYKIIAGRADKSYGIHVAELAGVPKNITERANAILATFENQQHNAPKNIEPVVEKVDVNSNDSRINEILKEIDIDNLTPRESFDILYQLKQLILT